MGRQILILLLFTLLLFFAKSDDDGEGQRYGKDTLVDGRGIIEDLALGRAEISVIDDRSEIDKRWNQVFWDFPDDKKKLRKYKNPEYARKRKKRLGKTITAPTITSAREVDYIKQYQVQQQLESITESGSSTLVVVVSGTSVSGINSSVVDLATSTNGTVTIANFTAPTSSTSTPVPEPTDLVIDKVAYDLFEIVANVTSYTLGALLPLTSQGKPYLAGVQYVEAFKCQVNLINSNRSILPKSYVTYLIQNSDLTIPQATGEAFLLSVRDTFMVVGPQMDTQVATVGYLYGPQNISFMSYDASSVTLANSTLYPSFFRTIPSDNFQARAMAETMTIFGWSFVAALFTNDAYGASGQQAFIQQAGRNRIKVTCSNSIDKNSTAGLQSFASCVAGSDASVVLLWMDESDAANALAYLYQNSSNSQLTFVASDRWALIEDPLQFNKTLERTNGLTFPLDYINGTLGFIPQIGQLGQYRACASQVNPENTNYTEFIAVWEDQFNCTVTDDDTIPPCPSDITKRTFECRCTNKEHFEDLRPDPLINYVQDSVLVMLQGLNAIMSPLACAKLKYPSICNLTEFSATEYNQALSLVSVTGLTGPIQFNQTKPDRRRANFDILQYNNDAIARQVGFWNISGPYLGKNLLSFKTDPNYPASVLTPDNSDISNGFWYAFVDALCFIAVALCIIALAIFTYYRRTRVVRRANLLWLYLIFASIAMILMALVFWTFTQTVFICTIKTILILFGAALFVACVAVRTERIFRVLINSDRVSMVLHNKELLVVAGLILIPDVILIIIYIIGTGKLPTPIIQQSNVDNTYLFIRCATKSVRFDTTVAAILLIYNAILIIMCTVVLLLSRHLQTAYNEAFFLFLILVDILIMAAIMIPLYYTVGERKGSILQKFLLRSLSIVFVMFLTMALLCYPRFNALWTHIKNKRARKKAEKHGMGASGRYVAVPITEGSSEEGSDAEFTSTSSTSKPRFISQTYTHKSEGRSNSTSITGTGSRMANSDKTSTLQGASSTTLQRRSSSASKSGTNLSTGLK